VVELGLDELVVSVLAAPEPASAELTELVSLPAAPLELESADALGAVGDEAESVEIGPDPLGDEPDGAPAATCAATGPLADAEPDPEPVPTGALLGLEALTAGVEGAEELDGGAEGGRGSGDAATAEDGGGEACSTATPAAGGTTTAGCSALEAIRRVAWGGRWWWLSTPWITVTGAATVAEATTATAIFDASGAAPAGTPAAPGILSQTAANRRDSHTRGGGDTTRTAARTVTRARWSSCRAATLVTPSSCAIAAGVSPAAERSSAVRWRAGSASTASNASRRLARRSHSPVRAWSSQSSLSSA
jgi:hypothetical protein